MARHERIRSRYDITCSKDARRWRPYYLAMAFDRSKYIGVNPLPPSHAAARSKYCYLCNSQRPLDAFFPKHRVLFCKAPCCDCLKAKNERIKTDFIARRANNKAARDYKRKLRAEAIAAYGGRCHCCGEEAIEFLGIDHMRDDGARYGRELKRAGNSLYAWLKQNGYPKDRFACSCFNCNLARGFFGYCPHKGRPAVVPVRDIRKQSEFASGDEAMELRAL